jgi:hypothetical protein
MDATTCSISIFMDDMINGNVTSSGNKFWMGLTTLSTELGNLNGNVLNIQNNMSLLSTSDATMGGYLTNALLARDNSQKIPTDALNGDKATISYNTPFTSSTPTDIITSVVGDVIGSSSNSSTISGALYATASKLYDVLL